MHSLARLPLNALRAFEAAARTGSMTAAAADLRVTHGAISRQVKALETQVGLPLLQRQPRGLTLTPEGTALAEGLADAFDRIRLALSRVKPRPMTLSCSATMMMFWLLPRLGDFKRAHPAVELRLDVNHGAVDFVRDEVSVAIRNSMYRPPPNALSETLVREEIGPVCHPAYAAGLGLRAAPDLAGVKLLTTATRPRGWAEWTAAVGVPALRAPSSEIYEHYYLVIQAAVCGLGMAVVPRLLVENEIAAGHLVAPLGFVEGPHSLELWTAEHLRTRPDVETLLTWLRDAMRSKAPMLG